MRVLVTREHCRGQRLWETWGFLLSKDSINYVAWGQVTLLQIFHCTFFSLNKFYISKILNPMVWDLWGLWTTEKEAPLVQGFIHLSIPRFLWSRSLTENKLTLYKILTLVITSVRNSEKHCNENACLFGSQPRSSLILSMIRGASESAP